MTPIVRFIGRVMGMDERSLDVVCREAFALVLPSLSNAGAECDDQPLAPPTAIVLYDVELEDISSLRQGTWTHIQWSNLAGEMDNDLLVWRIFIEGENVRVLI